MAVDSIQRGLDGRGFNSTRARWPWIQFREGSMAVDSLTSLRGEEDGGPLPPGGGTLGPPPELSTGGGDGLLTSHD
eukprot:696896-Pyramimonas_sp.AAC.1